MVHALVSRRVVTPSGILPAAVVIRDGFIAEVISPDDAPLGVPVTDLGDLALLPGAVDVHVHVNEPGRTDWEGFVTATRAAAAGGVTTLVDMPLNSAPVTTNVAALDEKRRAATGKCRVDVGFHGGVIPGNATDIAPLIDAGVLGIKAFLVHSGIDDFPNASLDDLQAILPTLARHNVPLLVHAEWDADDFAPSASGTRRYADFAATRPQIWETSAIGKLLALVEGTGVRLHIVHLAASDALPLLEVARTGGLPVTVETAPHYLTFDADAIPEGDTRFKCAPPIRDAANRERLWEALRDGTIDLIATDHSPCPPSMKALDTGDYGRAWGGIASLQSGLSAVWTGASARGFDLADLVRWMATAPAASVGLTGRKGVIAPSADADLIVFDPDTLYTLATDDLHYRHAISPYVSVPLRGRVHQTYLRGALVYDNGAFPGEPTGQFVTRNSNTNVS